MNNYYIKMILLFYQYYIIKHIILNIYNLLYELNNDFK